MSLRPRGQHAALRAATTRYGARLLALSPIAIARVNDDDARARLRAALACDMVLFTSPNAAGAAHALQALQPRPGQVWLAVGEGTRRALARCGVDAASPTRMDSEGLLAMPQLQGVAGKHIGLVTAPGGRGQLVPALKAGGADVLRADVYRRVPTTIANVRWQALATALASPERTLLALSSGEALHALQYQLPGDLRTPFCEAAAVAASARLAALARQTGFSRITVAADARPASLLHAAANAFV